MKKLVLFLALWSGIHFCSHAYTLIPDTTNIRPILYTIQLHVS